MVEGKILMDTRGRRGGLGLGSKMAIFRLMLLTDSCVVQILPDWSGESDAGVRRVLTTVYSLVSLSVA